MTWSVNKCKEKIISIKNKFGFNYLVSWLNKLYDQNIDKNKNLVNKFLLAYNDLFRN